MILASLAYNPRLWIGDAPKEMQAAVPPLNASEKRARSIFAIPFMLMTFGYPIYAFIQYESANGALNFLNSFFFFFIVWQTFNLVDLLFIDFFCVVWWNPPRFRIPDVEHLHHLNNYTYHFRAFLKGVVMLTVVSLIFAGIMQLF